MSLRYTKISQRFGADADACTARAASRAGGRGSHFRPDQWFANTLATGLTKVNVQLLQGRTIDSRSSMFNRRLMPLWPDPGGNVADEDDTAGLCKWASAIASCPC